MTSAKKIEANRANAKASRGPRSVRGKLRSALNARRHGLNMPVSVDPLWKAKITKLARGIGGRTSDPDILEMANRIAESGVDLIRIRKAAQDLCRKELSFDKLDNPKIPRDKAFSVKLSDFIDELELVARYERRALSRRKFAIRDLDAARATEQAGGKNRKPHTPLGK